MIKTLIDVSLHLSKNHSDLTSQLKYSHIIDSLMYIMNHTCPDIDYLISKLSGFNNNPENDYWKRLITVLSSSRSR